jgi:hypothetical protein
MMLAFSNLFLCSLGALVLTAQAGSLRGGIALWLAGFGCAVLLFETALAPLPLVVETEQAALLIFLMATFLLVAPERLPFFIPAGGLLAVLWVQALQAQGFPLLVAWLLVVLSLTTALHEGRTRTAFCTPALLQEVLIILLAVALAAALLPGVLEGWSTARIMSASDGKPLPAPDALSALAICATCFLCGTAFVSLKNHMNKRWKSL